MDPRVYMTLAIELAACAPVEYKRSAINRAYYAAYGVAHQALLALSCPIPRTAAGHAMVREILQECADEAFSEAGNLLHMLASWRVKADYDYGNEQPEEPKALKDCIGHCTDIIELVEAGMKERAKAQTTVDAARIAHAAARAAAKASAAPPASATVTT